MIFERHTGEELKKVLRPLFHKRGKRCKSKLKRISKNNITSEELLEEKKN